MLNSKANYTKYLLRNRVHNKKNVTENEHMAILAECLKTINARATKENYKTKEQLYALGFDAIQIQKYFIYINVSDFERDSCWILKPCIVIEEKHIKNIKDLINILKLNLKLAS